MSRLIEFYKGTGTDSEGRTLAMIWAYSHEQWEAIHDFIQWLFPLRLPSQFNPDAPQLTEDDIAEFLRSPTLQTNLRRSFTLFLDFLGLGYEEGRVFPSPDNDRSGVFRYPNHNWLRMTRVLTSTRLLGLEPESRAFFECLERLRDSGSTGITSDSFRYWEQAATGSPL